MEGLLLLLLIPAEPLTPPAPPKEHNPGGIYLLEGTEKEPYSGSVTIIQKEQIYLLTFVVGFGVTQGVGVRNGDYLAVGWTSKDRQGVTLYRIQGRSLSGTWVSLPGTGQTYRETLRFIKGLD